MDQKLFQRLREEQRDKASFTRRMRDEFNTNNGQLEELSKGSGMDMPSLDEVPDFIAEFVEEIKDLPLKDKLQAVHDFTLSHFTYTGQADCIGISLYQLMNHHRSGHYYGDCDNYALFEATILHLSGVPDVGVLGGHLEYANDQHDVVFSGGHVVAMVEDGDDIYVLDLNIEVPVQMKDGHGNFTLTEKADNGQIIGSYDGSLDVERAKLFISWGQVERFYFWTHDDDTQAYESTCKRDAPTDNPVNSYEEVQMAKPLESGLTPLKPR